MPENSDKKRRRAVKRADQSEFSDSGNDLVVRSAADLGLALRLARRSQGLSQENVALLTGLRRSYLSEMESGVTTERFDRLFALLDALGLELVARRRDVRRGRGRS